MTHLLAYVPMFAVSWLERLSALATEAETTGKAAGSAIVVVFVIVAAVSSRFRLGAIIMALIVGGVMLYGINNTDDLETNTSDTFIAGLPAPGYTVSAGGGAGGGGGGAL
jgi:hypothetical protein